MDGPKDANWVAALYVSESGAKPVGTGFLVDDTRVLTAAHVTRRDDELAPVVWVEFPRSNLRRRVRAQVVAAQDSSHDQGDAAVLMLDEPMNGLAAARLRCVDPEGLTGDLWWSYGFPRGDGVGSPAEGNIHGPLSGGLFLLEAEERYPVTHGFSGAPVWSDRYQAIVGLITQAFPGTGTNAGDARAVSMVAVQRCLPEQDLGALARWRLGDGPQDVEHWDPRARGVGVRAEEGFRFQGRLAALSEITAWMDSDARKRVLVVTGDPGAGKSAVLGRIVTSADPEGAQLLDATGDTGVRAQVGSIWCAVHAGGKTGLEIAEEIARAASAPMPHSTVDLTGQVRPLLLRDGHPRRGGHTLVIDAVDEAKSPEDAREILQQIAAPLAQHCADLGVRVVIGSRRHDARGELATRLGHAAIVIDLDASEYFALEDLEAYALASVQLRGNERADNPYMDLSVAAPVAARVALIADHNFLIAGLIARYHGLYDDHPVDPAQISLTQTIGEALALYLTAVPGSTALSAAQLLTALAYAPGLSAELWHTVLHALYQASPSPEQLRQFARGSAANFLIDVVADGEEREYRLFHQALNDVLLAERDNRVPDERAITRALIARGREAGWANGPAYLLNALARHAVTGQILDELLAEHDYLPHAEPRGLTPYLHRAHGESAMLTAAVYRAGVHLHENATPNERRGVLALDAARAGAHSLHHNVLTRTAPGRWVPRWATGSTFNPALRDTLTGHTDVVGAVACTVLDGAPVAVTGSTDRTVRVWDLHTGQQIGRPLTGHTDTMAAVACTVLDGAPVAVTGSRDRTVRVWDLHTGQQIRQLPTGHTDRVAAVACTMLDGAPVALSSGGDGTVRVWDLHTGQQIGRPLTGQTNGVWAMACAMLDGAPIAVTDSGDRTVRVWDLHTGQQIGRPLTGHTDTVYAVACTMLDGAPIAVTGSRDRTVRVWDLHTGQQIGRPLTGHTDRVAAVACTMLDGAPVALSSGGDGTVRVWDLHTGQQIGRPLTGHTDEVWAVACAVLDGAPVAVTGGGDGTVRVWDLHTGGQVDRPVTGHTDRVAAVACAVLDGAPVAVTGSWDETVRVWDLHTGRQIGRPLAGDTGMVWAVACAVLDGAPVAVTGSWDETVRVWDLHTGGQVGRLLIGDTGMVIAVACTVLDGAPVAVTGSTDCTVRVWDLHTGRRIGRPFTGHTDDVTAVACTVLDGAPIAVSGSTDCTVRVWDLHTRQQIGRPLTGHTGMVYAVACTVLDGAPIAVTGSRDHTVRVWDLHTGQQAGRPLTGHTDEVTSVACAVLDRAPIAVTGSMDHTVRVWDLHSRRQIERLLAPEPYALAFAAHGDLVVGVHRDIAYFQRTPLME